MKHRTTYSIGDMSAICNISRKALRYYDKIGLIAPLRQDCNNYRYYTRDALLAIPVIKYYKQMGFTLEEMRAFIEGRLPNAYRTMRRSFQDKLDELERAQDEIHKKRVSIRAWLDLLQEAETVIENGIREVAVKYVEAAELICLEQTFENDIKAAVINIDFTNFLEQAGNEISGPVILSFPSLEARVRNEEQRVRIMQKALKPYAEEQACRFGGGMMATCYHIGPHETLPDTYRKILAWTRHHGYTPATGSFERYVTDYWTTGNDAQFVTEVMIGVSRPG